MVASLKFSFDRRSPSGFQHEEEEVRVSLRLWASRAGKENPPEAWSPAIVGGDRLRRRFTARLAGFFLELALGARPILECISGRAAALQIDVVSAQRDLLRCRMDPGRSRISPCQRGTLARLGQILLPSTAASILHFVESHRFRIHWRPNRKIQYTVSTQRAPPERESAAGVARSRLVQRSGDAALSESEHTPLDRGRPDGRKALQRENPRARSTNREQLLGAVYLITVGLGKDVAGVAIPKGDFRARILGSERWEPASCSIQVLETLQCEMPAVCVHDQNVVNAVSRQRNLCRHGAVPPFQ